MSLEGGSPVDGGVILGGGWGWIGSGGGGLDRFEGVGGSLVER